MTKETKNGSTNFHASVKTYLPPTIDHDFVDDFGELQYALANGNTIPASRYNSVWNPIRGVVNMQGKGKGIDGRTNWIK